MKKFLVAVIWLGFITLTFMALADQLSASPQQAKKPHAAAPKKLHIVITNKFWQGTISGAPFSVTEWYQGKPHETIITDYLKKSAAVSVEYKIDSLVIQEQ
jgi:hypothetical protein